MPVELFALVIDGPSRTFALGRYQRGGDGAALAAL